MDVRTIFLIIDEKVKRISAGSLFLLEISNIAKVL